MANRTQALLVTILCLLSLIFSSVSQAQQPKMRFFKDKSGEFKIKAAIANLNTTHVKLRKVAGAELCFHQKSNAQTEPNNYLHLTLLTSLS